MRLIDADALRERMEQPECRTQTRRDFVAMVDYTPTIDAVPVVHGEWENHPHAYGFKRCSVCHDCNIWGEWADGKKWNYCPNCGACMDGGKDGV